jgi:tRNA/rRNA methyltransferase
MNSKPPAPAANETLDRVRIVLSRTSHPGNIGAAARAMKTMGLSRLVLADPQCRPDAQSEAMASGAGDVLAQAQTCGSLAEALAGTVTALAFTARRRELATEPQWVREAILEIAALEGEIALVFGNETSGLSNEELALCGRWAMIPANPAYSSLNLAAAVQLACYELRVACLAVPPAPTFTASGQPATHDEIEGLMVHLQSSAEASGFLDPDAPGRLMPRLRRLFARAGLEREEVNILRGLLASFARPTRKMHRPDK